MVLRETEGEREFSILEKWTRNVMRIATAMLKQITLYYYGIVFDIASATVQS